MPGHLGYLPPQHFELRYTFVAAQMARAINAFFRGVNPAD